MPEVIERAYDIEPENVEYAHPLLKPALLKRFEDSGYLPVGYIGEGQNAVVFEMMDVLGKRYAAKVFIDSVLEKFARLQQDANETFVPGGVQELLYSRDEEISAMAEMSGLEGFPVVESLIVGVNEKVVAVVMEFIEGKPLDEVMMQLKVDFVILEPRKTYKIVLSLLAALAQMHAKFRLHNDIKPANLILKEDGSVRILDFGAVSPHKIPWMIRRHGMKLDEVTGTAHYMPPERMEGVLGDRSADLYSVGVLLYHLLEGELPYDLSRMSGGAGAFLRSFRRKTTQELVFRNVVDGELKKILNKALAPKPEDRYQTAEEFGRALCFNAVTALDDLSLMKIF